MCALASVYTDQNYQIKFVVFIRLRKVDEAKTVRSRRSGRDVLIEYDASSGRRRMSHFGRFQRQQEHTFICGRQREIERESECVTDTLRCVMSIHRMPNRHSKPHAAIDSSDTKKREKRSIVFDLARPS